jgi:hypothetical protein
MYATEVLIEDGAITINPKDGEVLHFTWEEFDELEVAFDVVRRLSGAIRERKMLITIKEEKT